MKKNDSYKSENWQRYSLDYAKDHQKLCPEKSWLFKEILSLHKPSAKHSILEIGCNTGEFCFLLRKSYGVDPFGIDINLDAISIAKAKYPYLNFKVDNFFNLNGKYDIIYMIHVIEHIPDIKKALAKIGSLLSHDGFLITACPNGWAYFSKIGCLMMGKNFCYDPTHVHEFNPASLSYLLKSSGFYIDKIRTKPIILGSGRWYFPYVYHIPSSLFGSFIFCAARHCE